MGVEIVDGDEEWLLATPYPLESMFTDLACPFAAYQVMTDVGAEQAGLDPLTKVGLEQALYKAAVLKVHIPTSETETAAEHKSIARERRRPVTIPLKDFAQGRKSITQSPLIMSRFVLGGQMAGERGSEGR